MEASFFVCYVLDALGTVRRSVTSGVDRTLLLGGFSISLVMQAAVNLRGSTFLLFNFRGVGWG